MNPIVVVDRVPGSARLASGGPCDTDEAGWVGVAIDVLRASSTLTVAIAHGAAGVVPFAEVEAALAFRDRTPSVLACGERGGRILPDFDLGNSPFEYTRERVEGRTLAFASTNGSMAMLSQFSCRERWLGAFINASAVVEICARHSRVRLTCAGDGGGFSSEDMACAGWIVARLVERDFEAVGAGAAEALMLAPKDQSGVRHAVVDAPHGRALAALGPDYLRDVEYCSRLDALEHCASW